MNAGLLDDRVDRYLDMGLCDDSSGMSREGDDET
jgi:hypothetical protein